MSTGKLMASILGDSEGVILIDNSKKRKLLMENAMHQNLRS